MGKMLKKVEKEQKNLVKLRVEVLTIKIKFYKQLVKGGLRVKNALASSQALTLQQPTIQVLYTSPV